jgi:hypothetical protein
MTSTSPRTTVPNPFRGLAGLLAGLVAAASLVALPVTPAAAATSSGDRAERWAGYRIPSNGRAAGGWIGGYRVGRTPVFVITPERRPNRAGFRREDPTNDLAGRRGPSRRETQRAAWILSKYGGYRDARQAAAVDAAVLHLLGDREWRLGGARGAARVRSSGDPATVRRYVRVMLSGSRASAGRHRVTVVPATADVGGVTSVTVRVTDGHGGPVPGLPVTVTSPDGGTSEPAAGPVEAVTGDDGRAVVRLAAPLAGWRTVVARVGRVPEHRLRVRGADRRGQAAVAEGGVRRVVWASARVAVRGPQTVTLAPVPASLSVGAQAMVAATVSGDGSARGATGGLFGPFQTASSATCSGAQVGAVSMALPGDGTHTLPSIAPASGGYYAWRVDVDGTATSIPAASCGAVVKVLGRAVTSIVADGGPVSPDEIGATGSVSGLPFAHKVSLTATLAGPYGSSAEAAQNACASLPFPESTRVRDGNGSVHFTVARPTSPGLYAWQVQASAGDLWLGSRSSCAATGSLVLIQ